MKCQHGVTPHNEIPEGGWAGGVGNCTCCGTTFVFLNSGRFNFVHGTSWNRTWVPDDRCRNCGGKYVEYGDTRS